MRLMDSPRDLVEVYPSTVEADEFGVETIVAPPSDSLADSTIFLRCTIARPSTDSIPVDGYRAVDVAWLYCRRFPWLAKTVLRCGNELWDVVAAPELRNYSTPGTAGTRVRIERRGVP